MIAAELGATEEAPPPLLCPRALKSALGCGLVGAFTLVVLLGVPLLLFYFSLLSGTGDGSVGPAILMCAAGLAVLGASLVALQRGRKGCGWALVCAAGALVVASFFVVALG